MRGAFTYEPAIVQAPDGAIFVAGSNHPPGTPVRELLWASADGGATWVEGPLIEPAGDTAALPSAPGASFGAAPS